MARAAASVAWLPASAPLSLRVLLFLLQLLFFQKNTFSAASDFCSFCFYLQPPATSSQSPAVLDMDKGKPLCGWIVLVLQRISSSPPQPPSALSFAGDTSRLAVTLSQQLSKDIHSHPEAERRNPHRLGAILGSAQTSLLMFVPYPPADTIFRVWRSCHLGLSPEEHK